MLRRSSLVLFALALTLFAAACGGDDEDSTTEVSASSSETVVLPAHEVAAKDGARSHSESDVYECSSMDLEGDTGSAPFGGFQDVSVRGISCETGKTGILDAYKTYANGEVAAQVDGYDCDAIETYSDGLVTIRCATADAVKAFRFTAVPAHRKHVELVSECGTFGRYYDVSVRGQSCQDGATFLDNTPTSELTKIGEGDDVAVGSETCTTLYVEGRDRTVRCTQGKRALRFSIATRPSTTHPRKYVENPQESSQTVAKKATDSRPATKHGLSPDVAISCNATGPFNAIAASGVNCAAVTTLLTQNATELEAIQRGAKPTPLGNPPTFGCVRIDKGGETETIKCTATPSGATFRASSIPTSAAPPAGGNPPATTTPEGETTTPDAMDDGDGGTGGVGDDGAGGTGGDDAQQ
jgi:hypothetical protein